MKQEKAAAPVDVKPTWGVLVTRNEENHWSASAVEVINGEMRILFNTHPTTRLSAIGQAIDHLTYYLEQIQ